MDFPTNQFIDEGVLRSVPVPRVTGAAVFIPDDGIDITLSGDPLLNVVGAILPLFKSLII